MDRIVDKLNEKGFLQSVYTLMYTLPGIPSVYYGGEWGVEGRKEGACDDRLRPRLVLSEKMCIRDRAGKAAGQEKL